MLLKKTLSVLVLSALFASGSVWAATQQDEGRMGIPSTGTDAKGKKTVPKTLDEIPAKYCPADNPVGWDHSAKIYSGTKGWACSQLHLSGNNLVSLFDKAYVNAAAPGAKNLAYDYLLALTNKKIADGTPNDQAWGEMNKLSQKLHGNNVVGGYQNSFASGGYDQYDDPAAALMFDTLNRCGCVLTLTTSDVVANEGTLPNNNQVENGCPGAAATMCAATADRIKEGYWGYSHKYNKSFQDLAKSCIHFWNTLVNNTYNKKNGITSESDPSYVKICSTDGDSTCIPLCPQLKDQCGKVTFVGPGLVSGIDGKLYEYDGTNCKESTGKVDIVAQ